MLNMSMKNVFNWYYMVFARQTKEMKEEVGDNDCKNNELQELPAVKLKGVETKTMGCLIMKRQFRTKGN